ncbi:FadR/GntR family transcriptional regulator [Roseicyclus sp. F158]|uniref:FadR/GntR family transcriptional regulator n=1 Tax=Tropicimonas omnivorans TaxID=3075590 RepID=A0ABU3DEN8_9RHOB|nr:FadR/GntR family transcriptional regulator [Roseicyclus sp. F158]MDT0682181.1 FadR/GntR family transcriptional regulator [Roseicyclus sp. F158]
MSETAGQRARPPLAEKVYRAMHTRITRGDYGVNEKLPAEKELAQHFGVSRPVLRAALERLREEGLVYARQGAGNFVRLQKANPLGFARVETIADIQRCYEFRLTVEVEAAGLAAERRNEEILGEMRASLDMLADATGSKMHREDADFAFHVAVASGANNSYYVETLRALREHIYVGMKLHGESLMSDGPLALEAVLEEHRAIHDAIAGGQAGQAREVMRAHIRHSQGRLFGGSLLDLSL